MRRPYQSVAFETAQARKHDPNRHGRRSRGATTNISGHVIVVIVDDVWAGGANTNKAAM